MGTHGQSRNIKSTSVIHIEKGVPQLARHLFYGLILPSAGIIQEIPTKFKLRAIRRKSGAFTSLFGSTTREFEPFTREYVAITREFEPFTRELVQLLVSLQHLLVS
ncbi:hypothetical protein [Peribacillus simplex]|uniref:Uncharacterized protein n=1 Tax=Peribacillus simplex TaxID=1478 RepID=A0A9W4PF81_9BACI|nr:hypothetical protein [Peribacillus simplex]CAH0192980.1 hypothetical protein SRABI133_01709 [Peribacillus simplex]